MTMTFIQSSGNLSGTQTGIDFQNIPSNFTHLQIRAFTRASTTAVSGGFMFRFNGDSSNLYVSHSLKGDGATASATADLTVPWNSMAWTMAAGNGATANVFTAAVFEVLDYSNTNKNKVVKGILGFDNNGSGQLGQADGLYMSTNAINQITFYPLSANDWRQYTRIDLYGLSSSALTGA